MIEKYLVKLFEHNNWANLQIVQACYALSDEQLDAEPTSATKGSIRRTLTHLAASQQGYLSLLTQPIEARVRVPPAFEDLQESVRASGEGLLSLVRGEGGLPSGTRLQTKDGYLVEPWVVLVQVIDHGKEHREQICSMLTSLGVAPPDLDGWTFGEAKNSLVPMPT